MTSLAIITSIDRRSAIARATIKTASALAELAEVTIFAERTSQPLRCPLPLRAIDDRAIREHDHVIAALGDSPFHIRSFLASRRTPSIVILHDVLMAHLAAASLSLSDLDREFTRWYGPQQSLVSMAAASTSHPFWDGPAAMDAPLFEPATEFATGVIVHSRFAAGLVAARTVAPVRVIPLAYESPWRGAVPARPAADGTMLLTLGQVNANKCHELVIESLADLADPTVTYVIAGGVAPERRTFLLGLAASLGVGSQVDVLGSVSDERAASLLSASTICVNLRMPAMEGGSASLVEQMAAGKCVVVFDHGCYADAPDDAVVKLPTATSPQSLASALRALIESPGRREELGQMARQHTERVHSFPAYANQLFDFLVEVESFDPMTRLARRLADVTDQWGLSFGSPLSQRWATAVAHMLPADDAG